MKRARTFAARVLAEVPALARYPEIAWSDLLARLFVAVERLDRACAPDHDDTDAERYVREVFPELGRFAGLHVSRGGRRVRAARRLAELIEAQIADAEADAEAFEAWPS